MSPVPAAVLPALTVASMSPPWAPMPGTSSGRSPAIARTLVWGCRDGLALENGASASLARCTIAANAVGLYLRETEPGAGGPQAAADSLIVWDNGITVLIDPYSMLAVEWSDIEGGYDGTNNLSFDPLFVDAAGGDFRLQPLSPAMT